MKGEGKEKDALVLANGEAPLFVHDGAVLSVERAVQRRRRTADGQADGEEIWERGGEDTISSGATGVMIEPAVPA
jgi:hypothetical protein